VLVKEVMETECLMGTVSVWKDAKFPEMDLMMM
jgi:hypothetical protein